MLALLHTGLRIPTSLENIAKEARAVGQRCDAEDFGDCLPEIGERLAGPEIDARPNQHTGDEQRNVLSRVVGARRRRIVAVVGR